MHTKLFTAQPAPSETTPIHDVTLTVELMPLDKPLASARVVRHRAHSNERHVLLNILEASSDSLLGRVRQWVRRVENLSHVLVWTKDNVRNPNDACTVDLIELPRLQLTFERVCDVNGQARFFATDYVGYFVSNHQCPSTALLIQVSLPSSLFLFSSLSQIPFFLSLLF